MFAKIFALATLALAASAATIPAEKRSAAIGGKHSGDGELTAGSLLVKTLN